jgi:hypothetical protein
VRGRMAATAGHRQADRRPPGSFPDAPRRVIDHPTVGCCCSPPDNTAGRWPATQPDVRVPRFRDPHRRSAGERRSLGGSRSTRPTALSELCSAPLSMAETRGRRTNASIGRDGRCGHREPGTRVRCLISDGFDGQRDPAAARVIWDYARTPSWTRTPQHQNPVPARSRLVVGADREASRAVRRSSPPLVS